jgi:ubiquinone/menaquinone biosynthesis C-methylase UbiE
LPRSGGLLQRVQVSQHEEFLRRFDLDKPMPTLMFRGMSIVIRCRDIFRPRERILKEVQIKPGHCVLDFGCGLGSYTTIVAKRVGENGKVYALDIHPLSVKKVQETALKMGLRNIETIHSDRVADIPNEAVDIVLIYDVFHLLSEPQAVLVELYRVLRSDGVLSFSDHHMKEPDIISGVTGGALFNFSRKAKFTFTFKKQTKAGAA